MSLFNVQASSRVVLEDICCDCIIGVYPEERLKEQQVHVNLTLEFDSRTAAETGSLVHTIDYAWLIAELSFILKAGRFLLLESAAEALARYFLAPPILVLRRIQVERIIVSLAKPAALKNHGLAKVEIVRTYSDYHYLQEKTDFGLVDIAYENAQLGLYRLRIAPGASIPLHFHRKLREAEMVLTEGLYLQGKLVEPGYLREWPNLFPHTYHNQSGQSDTKANLACAFEQVVLCLNEPKFDPSDEVYVVDKAQALLQDVATLRLLP